MPDFTGLADDLKAAWNAPIVSMRARQRLLRALVTDIIADVDEAAREVVLTIHWRGGQHSQLRVRKPKTGEHGCRTSTQQRRQNSPQRLLVDAIIDAHPNSVRQIDLDHPDTLGQRQPGTARAYRTGRHWHPRAFACRIGHDTELNKFRRPHRGALRCHRRGLPCRSPVVQQACRNAAPAGNHRNLAALRLYFA